MLHSSLKINKTLQSDAFPVLVGQVLAQGLLFVAFPLISRHYPEESIGQWSVLQSVAILLWSFSQLKTDWSLVQAVDDKERSDLFFFGLSAHVVITILFIATAQISGLSPKLPYLLWLIGGLLAYGFNQMTYGLLLATKQYTRMGWLRALTALLVFPGSIVWVNIWPTQGLLFAWLSGNFVPGLVFCALHARYLNIGIRGWSARVGLLWQRHRKLMTFGSALAVLDTAADQLLLILMAWYYDGAAIAAYFFALKICSAPVSLIAGTLGATNFVHYQQLHLEKRLDHRVMFSHWSSWLPIGTVYYGFWAFFGTTLLPWLLGIPSREAGLLLPILAVSGLAQFLTSPVSSVFIVLQKNEYPLWLSIFTVIRLSVSAGMMAAGYPLTTMLAVFVAIALIHYFIYNLFQYQILRRQICIS